MRSYLNNWKIRNNMFKLESSPLLQQHFCRRSLEFIPNLGLRTRKCCKLSVLDLFGLMCVKHGSGLGISVDCSCFVRPAYHTDDNTTWTRILTDQHHSERYSSYVGLLVFTTVSPCSNTTNTT